MIKWTTPTLKCNIPEGLEFDYILLTLKQGKIVIEKTIEKESVIDNAFSVFFSQDETSLFAESIIINAQLNIMYGNTRQATNIVDLKITRNLHDEYIEGEVTPTETVLIEDTIQSLAIPQHFLSYDKWNSIDLNVPHSSEDLSKYKFYIAGVEYPIWSINITEEIARGVLLTFQFDGERTATIERNINNQTLYILDVSQYSKKFGEVGDIVKLVKVE